MSKTLLEIDFYSIFTFVKGKWGGFNTCVIIYFTFRIPSFISSYIWTSIPADFIWLRQPSTLYSYNFISTSKLKWNHIVPGWNYIVPTWNCIVPSWNYMVPPRTKKLGFLNFWGWKKILANFCDAECEIGFLKILF